MRRIWVAATLGALFLYGCQGSSRHTVTPGTQGSLEGVQFLPLDHSRDVGTDIDPEIFWLPGYQPPTRFTVMLKRIDEYGDYQPVNTELERVGTYRWKLKVAGTLNEGALYAITVSDDTLGEQREAWFLTEKSRSRNPGANGKENARTFEHKVNLQFPSN